MPLQNRVTPTGDIIATPHRGLFTGNRGIIHDPATKTLLRKRWSSPAWLTCVCEFRGRRRKVMGGAELDRTVLSRRGHRVRGRASPVLLLPPRRRQPVSRGWEEGNGVARSFSRPTSTRCCIASGWTAARSGCIRCRCRWSSCPTARWCRRASESYLIVQGRALQWSPAGYRKAEAHIDDAMLLTPPSTLRALAAGYRPVLHPSAASASAACHRRACGSAASIATPAAARDSASPGIHAFAVAREQGLALRRRRAARHARHAATSDERNNLIPTAAAPASRRRRAPSVWLPRYRAASAPCRNWWWRRCCSSARISRRRRSPCTTSSAVSTVSLATSITPAWTILPLSSAEQIQRHLANCGIRSRPAGSGSWRSPGRSPHTAATRCPASASSRYWP